MMAGSSDSFKDLMWLVIWKKREYLNSFRLQKCAIYLIFDIQVLIKLKYNKNISFFASNMYLINLSFKLIKTKS